MLSTKQALISVTAMIAASEAMTRLEKKKLEKETVKMFFSDISSRNKYYNKLRKSKSKRKAAKMARKKNRRT